MEIGHHLIGQHLGITSHIAGVPVTVTRSAFAGFARMVTVVGPGGWSSHLYLEPDMLVTVGRKP